MIFTIGNTYRTSYNAVNFKNMTGNNLLVSFMRQALGPGSSKSFALANFDNTLKSSMNQRETSLYSVAINSTNTPFFLNDEEQLCSLIKGGQLIMYTTTYFASSGTFTVGASASPVGVLADGSINYA